ncbi:MAG: hypothetical protein QXP36_13375 [Conexivisphaerales archaeon]
MKFKKKLMHQKDKVQKEEVLRQTDKKSDDRIPVYEKDVLQPKVFEDMEKRQRTLIEILKKQGSYDDIKLFETAIPILKNAFPKLLIPYISNFIIDFPVYQEGYLIVYMHPHIDIPFSDSSNLQSTMIDTLGSKIASELDRIYIDYLSTVRTPTIISSKPDRLTEELDKLITRVKLDNLSKFSEEYTNIALVCNDSDEKLLQSTGRYHRVNDLEFKDKLFKVGMLFDKYRIYITPAIDKGKALVWNVDPTNVPVYAFYRLLFRTSCNKCEAVSYFRVYGTIWNRMGFYTYCDVIQFE